MRFTIRESTQFTAALWATGDIARADRQLVELSGRVAKNPLNNREFPVVLPLDIRIAVSRCGPQTIAVFFRFDPGEQVVEFLWPMVVDAAMASAA